MSANQHGPRTGKTMGRTAGVVAGLVVGIVVGVVTGVVVVEPLGLFVANPGMNPMYSAVRRSRVPFAVRPWAF